jgi:hypothetical protein
VTKTILTAVAATVVGLVVLGVAMPAWANLGSRPGFPTLVQILNGSPSGGAQAIAVSVTSARQTTAYTAGGVLLLVNDGAAKAYCVPTNSSGTATTSNAVPIPVDKYFYITLAQDETHVACITASGTTTVRLFVMR